MAKSRSTSDTCSVCGDRIDICKKKNTCSIAQALNKEARIKQIAPDDFCQKCGKVHDGELCPELY